MLIALLTEPPGLLEDHQHIADGIRVFIITVGITLALVSLKVGMSYLRERDWERVFGVLAFACFVVTPSITALYRFDQPLAAIQTVTYCTGLAAGVVATAYRVYLRWPWWRRLKRALAARMARRSR